MHAHLCAPSTDGQNTSWALLFSTSSSINPFLVILVAVHLHSSFLCISQLLIKKSHWSRSPSVGIAALLNVPLGLWANDALVLPKALGPTNTAILRPERKIESIVQLGEPHFWR